MEQVQLSRLFERGTRTLRVTPLKYLTGDFGAAGTTRAAAVLMSLCYRKNLPSLPLAALARHEGASAIWESLQTKENRHALMTGTTFGGGTCSMVFSRYE
jgi:3-oxoacyl-(acyl-carrier-protein) synthase